MGSGVPLSPLLPLRTKLLSPLLLLLCVLSLLAPYTLQSPDSDSSTANEHGNAPNEAALHRPRTVTVPPRVPVKQGAQTRADLAPVEERRRRRQARREAERGSAAAAAAAAAKDAAGRAAPDKKSSATELSGDHGTAPRSSKKRQEGQEVSSGDKGQGSHVRELSLADHLQGPAPKGRTMFGRTLSNMAQQFNEVLSTRHGWLITNTNDWLLTKVIKETGEWCEEEVAVFRQLLQPGMSAVDVGANIGAFVLPLSNLVGPAGRVYAFEAQRLVHQALCGAVALNQLENVVAHWAAVGDSGVSLPVPLLDPNTVRNFASVSLVEEKPKERSEMVRQIEEKPKERSEMVRQITLDSLDLPPFHLLKIDVEGMEAAVIRGARGVITQYRPALYFETNLDESCVNKHSDCRLQPDAVMAIQEAHDLDYALWYHVSRVYTKENFAQNPVNNLEKKGEVMLLLNVLGIPMELSRNIVGLTKVVVEDLPRIDPFWFG